MLGIKLVLLLECSLQAFGLIVGGYSFILPSGQGVPETVINAIIEKDNVVNSRNGNSEIEIVCAEQQLVEGMNYKVYFKPNEQDLCYTKVYYISWLNYLDVQELSCNAELSLPLGCKNLGRFSNRPKRSVRSVDVVSMSKVRFYNYDKQVKALFDEFIRNHQREYSESADSDTYQKRYEIFAQNYETAKMLNRTDKTAHYGITKFMDYSYDEFHMYSAPGFTKPLVDIRTLDLSGLDASAIPDSVDWRDQGAVTEVKNQGQCGSCWAFSTTGNIEGQWFLKHKKLYSLSEQELVDCDTLDSGCNGGLPSNAYKSIEKLGGLETESDYPYEGAGEKCSINKSEFKVTVNDSVALPKDENQLAAWLAKNGPISIGINANMMQFYFGGIAHPWKIFCNPKSLDHGVLIVGYGTEKGTPYWIIKNSWGPQWGEKGYYRIYRGDGSCGLNQMATSAIVN